MERPLPTLLPHPSQRTNTLTPFPCSLPCARICLFLMIFRTSWAAFTWACKTFPNFICANGKRSRKLRRKRSGRKWTLHRANKKAVPRQSTTESKTWRHNEARVRKRHFATDNSISQNASFVFCFIVTTALVPETRNKALNALFKPRSSLLCPRFVKKLICFSRLVRIYQPKNSLLGLQKNSF